MPESNTAVAEVTSTSTPASSAPSSAPSSPTASATPATSATAPASPTSERPLSPSSTQKDIANFLRQLDTPDATATPIDPAVPATAAIAQTQAQTTLSAKPTAPPQEAWPTILGNARTKALSEYGITPQVTPETFQKGIGFARAINENPIEFMNQLAANIANHPVWGPQLRSSAGRTLASAPATRPEPDIEVRNDAGQIVGRTYSAERQQLVQEWDWAQREEKLNQRIQPLIAAEETRQHTAQMETFQKEVNTSADTELMRVNDILDGRTDLGPKVAELMAQGVHHIDAALRVRKEFIAPTVAQAAQAAVLDTQLKKVAGNTVNGSGTQTPKPKIGPGSSQKEIAAYLRQLDEGAA